MRLGEPQKEVADGVIAGKTRQAQHGVQDAIGPQPLAVGEALGADHDRHQKRAQRVSQRDGVVGGRFGEGQPLLHLAGKTNLAEEGNETGQAAEG